MALLKEGYKNGAGVESKYWRIIDYRVNSVMKYVDITFGGWINEECRVAELELSDSPRKVRCMKSDYETYFGTQILDGQGVNPILQMYKFSKENDEFFKDSVDYI